MLQAVIFDMDGLMVDAEYLHHMSFKAVLKNYGVKPVVNKHGVFHISGVSADTFDVLIQYKLADIDDKTKRITLTPKSCLCVEEICSQFAIPSPADSTAGSSRSEKRKLDKHNFVPLYGIVKRPEA